MPFRLLRHVDLDDQLTDLFIDDTTLYGIGKEHGLTLIDISQPQQARITSKMPVLANGKQLHIHNRVAYLSGENILAAIDTGPLQELIINTGQQSSLLNTSRLPIGDYDLELYFDNKQAAVCHQALKITRPATGKGALTMEQFEKLLQKHPEAALILMKAGMGCVGCPGAQQESIEDGCKAHGLSDEQIDNLIEELKKLCTNK